VALLLDACPVCRQTLDASVLAQSPALCPGCGTDLAPFIELTGRAEHYARLGLEWLSRGRVDVAREVARRLKSLHSDPGTGYSELLARLAVIDGDIESAERALIHIEGAAREDIAASLDTARLNVRRARELYNYALSAAREGNHSGAAESLARAVELAPREAALWQLKAKVDLKAGLWTRLYDDLGALDACGVRPAQLTGVERLLPALPEAV
jgi:tetratricopeptide (TPR) repeat protein